MDIVLVAILVLPPHTAHVWQGEKLRYRPCRLLEIR